MLSHEDRINFLCEFVTRYDAYAIQKENGRYCRVTKPLTYDLLKEHEAGLVTLGFYQMYNGGNVSWVCYDLDTHGDESPIDTLRDTCAIRERLD